MPNNNILQYESTVWATADLLIGAGIKQSEFPNYMMPFFALIMVESRLIRQARELEKEISREEIEDFIEEFQDFELGYNDYVIRHNKTLKDICRNDKAFGVDFHSYLKSFDIDTQKLLGVDAGNADIKYLNISGVSGVLSKKKILYATVKAWSEIDLVPFSNSEITTLEEHIKRKWADISAETAGEQYTPDDIIALISEIIASKIDDNNQFLTVFDPTCGGGNLLFGVEDEIKKRFPNRPTATRGQDWSDSLYALAKIESRFRKDSKIEYGNSLVDLKFPFNKFNVVIANPPYGVDWKGYSDDIKRDQTERFHDLPSVSDGQFLFTQHILHHLHDNGISVVVHNGSTLFSGDAGSGESNIRKYFFDNDWVEALIQMPTDEFFNTGIYTYLWVFNKNKPDKRKDKVILINASEMFEPLKKSRGKKRKRMNKVNRAEITKLFTDFKDTNNAKVFDKWKFYFNKQAVNLTNIDENGKSIVDNIKGKSEKINPVKIMVDDTENPLEITEFDISDFSKSSYKSLKDYYTNGIKPLLSGLDYKEQNLKVFTNESVYWYDNEKETIIKSTNDKEEELGCGKIVIKPAYKKATKTKPASIQIKTELTPDYQKDYEIIPYSPNEKENQKTIVDFMAKYITKPFEYLDNVVGVEINFNKVFYKPEKLREVYEITADLKELENELQQLENELDL
jgi:type I restriction enzyme M protein